MSVADSETALLLLRYMTKKPFGFLDLSTRSPITT